MRISDWSSDVCSSDLSLPLTASPSVWPYPFRRGWAPPRRPRLMRAAVDGRSLPATGAVRDRASVLAALRTRRACLFGAAAKHICARTPPRLRSPQERVCLLDPPAEIGRASCRERGCQYG